MNRAFQFTAWATILSAIGLMILAGYWLLYPYRIIEFSDEVFPILNENKQVRQGEQVVYQVKYCKYRPVGSETTRSFLDGIIYSTPMIGSNQPCGCHSNLVYIEVPKAIPTGKVVLQMLYRYKVNPIRTIEIIKVTEPFTIIR